MATNNTLNEQWMEDRFAFHFPFESQKLLVKLAFKGAKTKIETSNSPPIGTH